MRTQTILVVALLVAISYGAYVYVGKKGAGGLKEFTEKRTNEDPNPGNEFRTGLTSNVPTGPSDARDFVQMLTQRQKAGWSDDVMHLISGPMYTGQDPAFGTIGTGAQVNRGKLPVDMESDHEGVIAYKTLTEG